MEVLRSAGGALASPGVSGRAWSRAAEGGRRHAEAAAPLQARRPGRVRAPGVVLVASSAEAEHDYGHPHSQRPPMYKHRPLPYKLDALEPHISGRALELHWRHHYGADVVALHDLTRGLDPVPYPLEELILDAYNNGNPQPHFNCASQVYNHEMLWESMEPGGGGSPPEGELKELLERDFGSVRLFWDEFRAAALSQFGAGYAWLVVKPERLTWNQAQPGPPTSPYIVGKLAVEKTANAINPLVWGHIPLLCLDVWEHAYYLNYRDNRTAYVDAFQGSLVSWGAAAGRLERAKAAVNMYAPELPEEIEAHLRGMEQRALEKGTLTPAVQELEPQVTS